VGKKHGSKTKIPKEGARKGPKKGILRMSNKDYLRGTSPKKTDELGNKAKFTIWGERKYQGRLYTSKNQTLAKQKKKNESAASMKEGVEKGTKTPIKPRWANSRKKNGGKGQGGLEGLETERGERRS